MAPGERSRSSRHRHSSSSAAAAGATASRHRSHSRTRSNQAAKSKNGDSIPVEANPLRHPDVDALRKARLDYLSTSPEEHRAQMKYIGQSVTRTVVTKGSKKTSLKSPATATPPQSSQAREERDDDASDDEYVYGKPDTAEEDPIRIAPKNYPDEPTRATETDPQRTRARRTNSTTSTKQTEQRKPIMRRQTDPVRRRSSAAASASE